MARLAPSAALELKRLEDDALFGHAAVASRLTPEGGADMLWHLDLFAGVVAEILALRRWAILPSCPRTSAACAGSRPSNQTSRIDQTGWKVHLGAWGPHQTSAGVE